MQAPSRQQLSKPKSKKKQKAANLTACRKKISYGHYTAAIQILSSNGIAPANETTLTELKKKHTQAPSPSIPPDNITAEAISVDDKAVLERSKAFQKGDHVVGMGCLLLPYRTSYYHQ